MRCEYHFLLSLMLYNFSWSWILKGCCLDVGECWVIRTR